MRWMGIAIAVVLVVAGILTMSSSFVRSLIYPAPRISVSERPPEGLMLPAWDLDLHGWLYRPAEPSAKQILLYFHGNGENLETLRLSGMLDELKQFRVPFLVIDYPGYGRSKGRASEHSILKSSLEATNWLKQNFPDHELILCGWSLGASVAIQTTSASNDTSGLIAMSAWSSLRDIAVLHYPGWLTNLLLKERYDALEAARNIRVPALFIHGESDNLIPAEQGKKVVGVMQRPARWVLLPGVGHNDLLADPQVWKEIQNFLKEL